MTTVNPQETMLEHFTGPEATGVPSIDPSVADLPVMLHYDHQQFRGRLRLLSDITGLYDGALPSAAASAQELPPTEAGPEIISEGLLTDTRRQIDRALISVQHTGAKSVVIEAGHVYAYEDLDDPQLARSLMLQAKAAHMLTRGLVDKDFEVKQVMFFDDYNPDPITGERTQRVTVEDVRAFLQSHGFDPTSVISEGAMVDLAHTMMDFMDTHQGLVKPKIVEADQPDGTQSRDVESLNLSYRGFELYRPKEDKVSCAMLDTALSMVKLHYLGDAVVNILPRRGNAQEMSYRSQQRKMRTILGMHLGARMLPIVNVFTDDNQDVNLAAGAHHDFRKQR